MTRIKCNGVNYRKGFLDISSDVHENFLNIEIWNIDPDFDITNPDLKLEEIPHERFAGNVEIELGLEEAKELHRALEVFIHRV